MPSLEDDAAAASLIVFLRVEKTRHPSRVSHANKRDARKMT